MDTTGVPVSKTGNGGNVYRTTIKYGAGAKDEAQKIADAMGTGAVPAAGSSLKADSIVVVVGGDFKQSKLTENASGGSPSAGATGDSSGNSSGGGLSSGTAVDASSQDGIPCVY
jgi:hypothetical protein